jgi:hypothetical protein
MKIGDLGNILKKDPLELAKAHNLAEDVETLEADVLTKILKTEFDSFEKAVKSASKDEGYKFAERKVKSDIEAKIKSEFGVDGENLESLFEGVKSKIVPHDNKTDEKLLKELEIYKGKFKMVTDEFEGFKSQIAVKEKKNLIFGKLESAIAEKYDVRSDKLKKFAFENFVNEFDFEVMDNEIHILDKQTKKPTFKSFEDAAMDYFKDVFPEKNGKSTGSPPPPTGYNPASNKVMGTSKADLLQQLKESRDPTEKEQIRQALKAL